MSLKFGHIYPKSGLSWSSNPLIVLSVILYSWAIMMTGRDQSRQQSVRDRLLHSLTFPLTRHFLLPGVSHLVSLHQIILG